MNVLKQLIPISRKNYEARYSIILHFMGNILNLKANNDASSVTSSLLCQKTGEDLKISLIFYLNIFRNWVSFLYFSSAFLYLLFYFDRINNINLPIGIKSFLLTMYNFIMYKPFN